MSFQADDGAVFILFFLKSFIRNACIELNEFLENQEPLTPPPLAKRSLNMTSGLPLETNGSDRLTPTPLEDGINKQVTSSVGIDNDNSNNKEEHNEVMSEMLQDEPNMLIINTESNSESVHNETNNGVVEQNTGVTHSEIGSELSKEINTASRSSSEAISHEVIQKDNNIPVQHRPENVPLLNNSEAITPDVQVRPPFKGVMVPCGQLKEYLDSLPTFNRKTMLRKGREVHKIYVDMKKGECFLDDQFSYTEFGKLVLSNGSIRAGRAKNAKQIVVARETLYCSGTGACKRACGGFGVCAPGM